MSNVSKCLLAVLILLLPAAAHAADGAWIVREVSGKVRLEAPATAAQPASVSDTVPLGASLTTGGDGRVVLFNGKQEIVMGPNSRMTVPVNQQGAFTRILQDLGTLMFKVDKRPEQHFEVQTPMIAAVVKGTTFAVTAGAATDSVYVAEGLVEVSTRNGAGRTLVPAGTTALVSHANPSVIDVQASNPATVTSAPSTSSSAPAKSANASGNASAVVSAPIGAATPDYGKLSNGLVQTPSANPSAQVSARASNAPGAKGAGNANARSAVSMGNPHVPTDGLAGSRALLAAETAGNGNGKGLGIGNSNAGGIGNGNGVGNGSIANVGNSNAGGNGNSNAGGNGNSNAGGNSTVASANSNANSNSNANANSNAGGNSNSNAGGNSNSNSNGNAGGNSNSNSSAGGNSNSNAGGNGKGKK